MFGFIYDFVIKSSICFLSSNSQTTPLGVSTASGIAALWHYKFSLNHSTVDRGVVRDKKLDRSEKRYVTIKGTLTCLRPSKEHI